MNNAAPPKQGLLNQNLSINHGSPMYDLLVNKSPEAPKTNQQKTKRHGLLPLFTGCSLKCKNARQGHAGPNPCDGMCAHEICSGVYLQILK